MKLNHISSSDVISLDDLKKAVNMLKSIPEPDEINICCLICGEEFKSKIKYIFHYFKEHDKS